MQIWFYHCFYTWLWWFFLGKCMGTKSTIHVILWQQCHLYPQPKSCANNTTYFSNSHQNCSEIVSVDEIMGNKTNMMIGQRISWSGKSRWKQDFSPQYLNAAFFSMRGNLRMRLLCITQFHLLLCSQLQAMVRESPQETKCTTFEFPFFLGYFFFKYSSQNMFFPHELQQICVNSTCKWMNCVLCKQWLRNHWNGTQHVNLSHFQQTRKVAFLTLY